MTTFGKEQYLKTDTGKDYNVNCNKWQKKLRIINMTFINELKNV